MKTFLIVYCGMMEVVPIKLFNDEEKAILYQKKLLKYYEKINKEILIENGEHHPDVLNALFVIDESVSTYSDIVVYTFEKSVLSEIF